MRGYRAGFFMGIKNIASGIIGFLAAVLFSQPLALFLTEKTPLAAHISGWLEKKVSGLAFQPDDLSFISGLPEILQEQMNRLFPQDAVSSVSSSFVEWLSALLVGCIAFAILLLAVLLAVRFLARLLDATMDALLPSYLINHTAGAALYGIQFALLLSVVLYISRPLLLTGNSMQVAFLMTLQQAVENSALIHLLESAIKSLGLM